MRWALLVSLVASVALGDDHPGRFRRFCTRTDQGRTERGFDCGGALFEAFPSSGAGTTGVCSTTTPTGSKGEALTATRASSATCTKTATGGLVSSGIAVGDLVTVSSNILRQEFDPSGTLGVLIESAGTADDVRPEELDNAAWVATATVTANAATPPNNTNQVSNAEQLSDGSGAAFQGVCQVITTTSATQHTFFVHVRAGTASAAQVTMTGTGSSTGDCSATVTGLSSTTWNILSCTSPAAYAGTLTAVTVCVNVGSVAGDTGTIMAWGTDHKVSAPYRTSYVPGRTNLAATRAVDSGISAAVAANSASGSVAMSVTPAWTSGFGPPSTVIYGARYDGQSLFYYNTLVSAWRINDGSVDCNNSGNLTALTTTRVWGSWAGSFMNVNDGTDTTQCAFDGQWGTPPLTTLLISTIAGSALDGIFSKYCLDVTDTRCR